MKSNPQHTSDWKSMLRNPYGLALVAYYAVMAVVGMLIPEDILRSHAWAREFSDFMASFVPQIDRITALNIKPDVNRFYFSVLWAGSPVLASLIFLGAYKNGINTNYVKPDSSGWSLFGAVIFGFTLCLLAVQMPYAESSPKLTNGLIGLLFFRGLFGQIIFTNGPIMFFVVICVNLPYFIFTGKYQKAIENKRREPTNSMPNDGN